MKVLTNPILYGIFLDRLKRLSLRTWTLFANTWPINSLHPKIPTFGSLSSGRDCLSVTFLEVPSTSSTGDTTDHQMLPSFVRLLALPLFSYFLLLSHLCIPLILFLRLSDSISGLPFLFSCESISAFSIFVPISAFYSFIFPFS